MVVPPGAYSIGQWKENNKAVLISSIVFATTAANGRESSYACYWDEELRTYLGDVYSIKWMEDSDSVNVIIKF